jgi:arylsulfatase A-like enzyme
MYPTLLEIAGVTMDKQPPLDGISLTSLLDGKMTKRPGPMGFWSYPPKTKSGVSGEKWMQELLKEQQEGKPVADQSRLYLDAGEIKKQYGEDDFFGHAAWLDWPWKLHRIEGDKKRVYLALYNLEDDPGEKRNVRSEHADKVDAMKSQLERWMASVIHSLNGNDYA